MEWYDFKTIFEFEKNKLYVAKMLKQYHRFVNLQDIF